MKIVGIASSLSFSFCPTLDVPNLSYDCDLITAVICFPFAFVFTRTFTECVT